MSGWWEAVGPATAEVTCGEERHRISWRRGKVVLDDHDLAAEESFAALGGEPALCLEVLRAWRAAVDDREVLWFWDTPRIGDPDMNEMLVQVRSRHQHMLASHRRMVVSGGRHAASAPGGPIPPEVLERLRTQMAAEYRRSLLSALPDDLRLRLGLSAIVRACRRQADRAWYAPRAEDVRTALAARAAPAVEGSMRAWRGRLSGRHTLVVECWITRPGEPPNVCGLMDDAGGWAAASLPMRWLVDVWARGVALVEGCLVLEVLEHDATGDHLAVSAARWERRLPAGSTPVVERAILFGADGSWHLRWDA
ncbi:MAG: hypothetical protein M3326_08005 [Actinomycetota bacterium]|nr:hypothetical protein [Actinomycetota bacterium]